MIAKIVARIGTVIAATRSPMNKTLSALRFTALACATAILLAMIRPEGPSPRVSGLPATQTVKQALPDNSYGRIPLSFEVNHGQTDESVDFLARGSGYTLFLEPTEAVFRLKQPSGFHALRARLVGARTGSKAEGMGELTGKVNYLIGNDPAKWRTNVSTFGQVRYRELYPGIDLVYHGNQRQLEYDFVIQPGKDYRQISFTFEGADKLKVEPETGDLLVSVGEQTVRQRKPVTYQEVDGERREIESSYKVIEGERVAFWVGTHDQKKMLIIDPVLVYSTYLGGTSGEYGYAIALDSAGNAYLTGDTSSTDFPGTNKIQSTNGGGLDVFVAKINASGSAIVYSTYLGGSAFDIGWSIAVDSAGNAYVAGSSTSENFPLVNPLQATKGGGSGNTAADAFLAKLNPAGSALVYSTYLGGSGDDQAKGIAVDESHNAYVTGFTLSADFPTANPLQGTYHGAGDAFIAKINAAGSALTYSTFLGGSLDDTGLAVAVDVGANAYVAGYTGSSNFPTAQADPRLIRRRAGCFRGKN
jgi:hypothetical protein